MNERGTVAIDRGLFGHEAFADEPFTEREAWIWLIMAAAFKPHSRRVGSAIVKLKRGELAHSLRFMARKWKWPLTRVHRFVGRLRNLDMIRVGTPSTHQPAHLTICNYEDYQPRRNTGDEKPEQSRKRESPPPPSGGVSARARELTDELYTIFGFGLEDVPPRWVGLEEWADAGLRGGWKVDLVRIAARKALARRKGTPPADFRYLGPFIVDEHELAAAPPPRAAAHKGASHGKRTVQDAARELAERLAAERDEREQRTLNLLRTFDGG
jgi:hypothetical protein